MARARYAEGKRKNLKYGGRPVESRRRAGRIRSERRRKAWLEAGRCTRCGQNSPVKGGTTCTPCRTRRQDREREVYSQRRSEGLCVRCGVRTFEGAAMCGPCNADEHDSGRIERKNARNRERYQERKSAGRCTECGQQPSHGASRCVPCAERSYARSAHFRGMPDWDPEHYVVDLVTGEEYGPFASEAEGAAHIAFLKLPAGRCEIISDVPLGLRYTGGVAWEDTVR